MKGSIISISLYVIYVIAIFILAIMTIKDNNKLKEEINKVSKEVQIEKERIQLEILENYGDSALIMKNDTISIYILKTR